MKGYEKDDKNTIHLPRQDFFGVVVKLGRIRG